MIDRSPFGDALVTTRHVILFADRRQQVVRFFRTSVPYESIAVLIDVHEIIMARLRATPVAGMSLLIDIREGPARNDPAFEQALAPLRPQLFALFDRSAVLVQSAIGRLQATRHAREDGELTLIVTQDEAEALRFLAQPPPRRAG